MLTTTIGAYPKPADVPIRDWIRMDGGTDTPEPTAGYVETLRQYGLAELRPGQVVFVRYGDGATGLMAAEIRPDASGSGPTSH